MKKAHMTFNTWKTLGWPTPTLDAWESRDDVARVVQEQEADEEPEQREDE